MEKSNKLNESMSEEWHFHPKLPVGFYSDIATNNVKKRQAESK